MSKEKAKREFVIWIRYDRDWEIFDKRYEKYDVERIGEDCGFWKKYDFIFAWEGCKNGKIVHLFDMTMFREIESLKKIDAFNEIVDFECYVIKDEDKEPFEVKDKFTGTIWQGVEWVNEHYV